MAGSARATMYYDRLNKRWVVTRQGGEMIATWTDDGYNTDEQGRVIKGTGTITNLDVGTTAVLRQVNVAGQGSIANLNTTTGTITNLSVGSSAIIQQIRVAGQGSIANLNTTTGTFHDLTVGSTAVIRRFNTTVQGSINTLDVAGLNVGGGGSITLIKKHTGTIALTAIGTGAMAVATLSGLGSAGIAVGDLIFGNPKAELSGVGFSGLQVPTTNVVVAYITNPNSQGGGSLPAVGVDVIQLRSA